MGFTKNKLIKVGVAVTNDNRMDVVVVDVNGKMVTNYKTAPVEYNFQTKEISNYMDFSSTLRSILVDEMNLNLKNIELTLTIPSIHLATLQTQTTTDQSALETMCAYYAQESYLFKRHNPVVAAQGYPTQGKSEMTVVYSAIQESVADQIKDALTNMGIEKFSINNAYGSVINALNYLGLIEQHVNSNERWNFVQITNTGFVLFSMNGTRIVEINDMPLPLKTFSPEEIYESMALSLQNNLSIYPASSLYLVSRTDLLSAEILLQRMDLRWDVNFLDNNKYNTKQIIATSENVDPELANIMSIEAIGSTITDKNSPLNLCYVTSKKETEEKIWGYVTLFGQEIAVNDKFLNICIFSIIGFILLVVALLYFSTSAINGMFESAINKYKTEKSNIEQQISKAKGETEGNVENIISSISKNNQSTVTYFNAISTEIPDSIWLTYYYSDSTGALAVKGDTADVESIYDFYKGMKTANENSRIRLSKLEYNDIDAVLTSNEHGNKSLNFEITNDAYSSVTKMMASQVPENEESDKTKTPSQTSTKNIQNQRQPEMTDEFDESGFPPVPQSGLKPPTK